MNSISPGTDTGPGAGAGCGAMCSGEFSRLPIAVAFSFFGYFFFLDFLFLALTMLGFALIWWQNSGWRGGCGAEWEHFK